MHCCNSQADAGVVALTRCSLSLSASLSLRCERVGLRSVLMTGSQRDGAFELVDAWLLAAGHCLPACLQIVVVLLTMLYRNFDRMVVWLLTPHDDMLLVESEKQVCHMWCNESSAAGSAPVRAVQMDMSSYKRRGAFGAQRLEGHGFCAPSRSARHSNRLQAAR